MASLQYEWYKKQKAIRVQERQQKLGASNLLKGYRAPDQDMSLTYHKQLIDTKLQQLERKQSAIRHRHQYGIHHYFENDKNSDGINPDFEKALSKEEQTTSPTTTTTPTTTKETESSNNNSKETVVQQSSPPPKLESSHNVANNSLIKSKDGNVISKPTWSPQKFSPPPLFAVGAGGGSNALDEWRKQQKLLKETERQKKQSCAKMLCKYRGPQTDGDKSFDLQKQIQQNKIHQLARKESAIRYHHQYGINNSNTPAGDDGKGTMTKLSQQKQHEEEVHQRQNQKHPQHATDSATTWSTTTISKEKLLLSSIEESLASPPILKSNSVYSREEVDAAA